MLVVFTLPALQRKEKKIIAALGAALEQESHHCEASGEAMGLFGRPLSRIPRETDEEALGRRFGRGHASRTDEHRADEKIVKRLHLTSLSCRAIVFALVYVPKYAGAPSRSEYSLS